MKKQYNYDYPSHYKIEGVEERLIDSMCEILSSSVNEVLVTTSIGDAYKNFTVKLNDGKELDCEIAFIDEDRHWKATVWELQLR